MDDLYLRTLFGENARHVPAWVVIQDAGEGVVAFVGASRMEGAHPLRYGSEHTHQLIVGELVVRPHVVYGSDALRGMGLAHIVTDPFPLAEGVPILGRAR